VITGQNKAEEEKYQLAEIIDKGLLKQNVCSMTEQVRIIETGQK